MQIYLVVRDRAEGIWNSDEELFRGTASRKTIPSNSPLARGHNYSLGEKLDYPNYLTHSIQILPQLFKPSLNWFVSETVKSKLDELVPAVTLLKVEWEKPVDADWIAGRRMQDKLYARENYDLYALSDRFKKAKPRQLENYYELILPHVFDEAARGNFGAKRVIKNALKGHGSREDVTFYPGMLRDYSILYADGCTVLSQAAYELLAPYIDRRFFSVETADLSVNSKTVDVKRIPRGGNPAQRFLPPLPEELK